MSRDSAVGTLAAASLMLAVVAFGLVVIADEYGFDINVTIVGAILITALGFVGLASIVWQLIRRLMD